MIVHESVTFDGSYMKNGFTFLESSGVWVVKLFDGTQYHLRSDGTINIVYEE